MKEEYIVDWKILSEENLAAYKKHLLESMKSPFYKAIEVQDKLNEKASLKIISLNLNEKSITLANSPGGLYYPVKKGPVETYHPSLVLPSVDDVISVKVPKGLKPGEYEAKIDMEKGEFVEIKKDLTLTWEESKVDYSIPAKDDLTFLQSYGNTYFSEPKANAIIKDIKVPEAYQGIGAITPPTKIGDPDWATDKCTCISCKALKKHKKKYPAIAPLAHKSQNQPFYLDAKLRGEIKNFICLEFDRQGIDYIDVNAWLAEWAGSANCSLQNAASIAFKISKNKNPEDWVKKQIAFIRAMYRYTQKDLSTRGIEFVNLYRGQYCEVKKLRPLSSFSTSERVANGFGNYVYKASIPAKYIVSTYFSGIGCAEEQEYVVMGGNNVERHLKLIRGN